MKYVKKGLSWISEHLSYVQAIITFIVSVISGIAGICENYLIMIITLLVFVGTEFTIITVGYLDKILKIIRDNKKETEIDEVIVNNGQKWIDLAQNAKHDIFLSGVTMASLYQERRLISNVSNNIQINILVHNPNDNYVTEQYCKICNPKASIDSLKSKQQIFSDLANDIGSKTNICIKMTDDPLYIQFVACDVFDESEVSYIRAQHCLRKYLSEDDTPKVDHKLIYGVKKDSSVYEIYKQQILKLWEKSRNYCIEEN